MLINYGYGNNSYPFCKLIFVNTRNANIYHLFLPTHDIKNFKHRGESKCRQNVVVSISAPLCIQTSCSKPGPLAKVREMNSNAAKNHVSISAPKQHVRCCKMSGPLRPLGPLRKPKMFAQNFSMPPCREAAKMLALLIYQHLYAINRRAISPCPLMT